VEHELSIHKEGLVSLVESHDLADIIKPLTKEIHLFDSFVAGTTHLQDKSVLDEIKVGDKLTLRREDNKFDSNAILILNEDMKKLGYVPERDNIVFSRLMDAGKFLSAKVLSIKDLEYMMKISISIYLVDY
jgi:hypothetical protein